MVRKSIEKGVYSSLFKFLVLDETEKAKIPKPKSRKF